MMLTDGLTSSNTDSWATPQDMFDALDSEFHFTLDVCADETNHKCSRFYTRHEDGLRQDWTNDVAWMNPPYGRDIPKWVAKAVESARGGNCCRITPGSDGHALVEGLCYESQRTKIHFRSRQVRRLGHGRAVSVGHSDMGDGDDTEDSSDRTGLERDRMTDPNWFETTKESIHSACVKGSKWHYDDGMTTFAVMPSQHEGYITLVISTTSRLDNLKGYITYHNPILIPDAEIPYLIRALQEMVQ